MKLSGIPIFVFLILFAAVIFVLKHLLTSTFQQQIQFTSSPLFLFSLLNTILFAIMVGSYRPYTCPSDEILLFFNYSHELEDIHGNIEEDSDEYDNIEQDSDEFHGSEDYDEDVDDNGSNDEVCWEDEEEGFEDNNLLKRIEDFIAKVNNTWKEEKLRDKLNPG